MSMATLIRQANVYQPEYAGVKDVLLLGGKIAAIGENLKADFGGCVDVLEIQRKEWQRFPASSTAMNTFWARRRRRLPHQNAGSIPGGSHPQRDHHRNRMHRHRRRRTGYGRTPCQSPRPGQRRNHNLCLYRFLPDSRSDPDRKSEKRHPMIAGQSHRRRRNCNFRPPFLPAHL